jgi:uncharacterized protein (TIGR00251 family)
MRVTVRVRPRSSRREVGGSYAGALVVAVREPAVDGRATAAALDALAEAFGVPRRSVRLVTGASSRQKVVEVTGDETVLAQSLTALLAGG